ncbi:MAG: phosphoserine phosphatase SerB [Candidatus Altiarchaeales archaeon]|nr:MAG: phosphoserine phosphatase SerB [Candidatus Altiarchaeales archaeon]
MKDLLVITILGEDRPGLVAKISGALAKENVNIVDIEQSVIRNLFSMFMIVDLSTSEINDQKLNDILYSLAQELKLKLEIHPYESKEVEEAKKKLYNIKVIGKDKPGIVAAISSVLAERNVNIERIKMLSRGELIVMEMIIDIKANDPNELRRALIKIADEIAVDIIFQSEEKAKTRKKLIVFDMDSTLVDAEIIDELAKAAGVENVVKDITARGMRGEIDFKEALKERVKLLKGLPIEVLEEIRDNLVLTPGCEELVRTLKAMGYKLALISGGFTFFTDALKERLGFDYAFANKLVIKDGKLTGEIEGEIIDSKKKAEILEEIAKKENISKDEIVAIGDGANDRIMLENAGLGIAFNAKEILKKVADGKLTKENLMGILYCLGHTKQEYKK